MTVSTRQLLKQVFPKMGAQSATTYVRHSTGGQLTKRHTSQYFLRNGRGVSCRTFHNPGSSAVLSLMPPQPDISNCPHSISDTPLAGRKVPPAKVTLPFQWLQPFAQVDDQLSVWGVHFEGAIAINPSNPHFYSHRPRRVIMPMGNRRSLTIHLQKPFEELTLQVRGYRDISVTALDQEGHCISHCKTFRHRLIEQEKAPVEQLTIDLAGSQKLILESSGPFILESFQL